MYLIKASVLLFALFGTGCHLQHTIDITRPPSQPGFRPVVPPPDAVLARVNCGGPVYTDTFGNAWSADANYSGGSTFATPHAIASTTDQALYQTERFGNSTYTFGNANGQYTVNLKFAELYWTAPNQRIFNVSINGQPVLTNFDIYAQAGAFTALDKSFTATASNGQIVIQLTTVKDNAKIGAIEILSQSLPPSGGGGAIATGQTPLPSQQLAAGACSAPIAAAAPGVLASDAIAVAYATDPAGIGGYGPGGGITLRYWPTTGYVNFRQCNESSGNVTPGAMTINWTVHR